MTTTTQAGMTMAKADAADMTALLDVVGIVESMAKGWMPELKDDTPVDKPVDDCFDIENIAHCRYVLDMLLRANQRGSLFRAAFGLTVLLHPKNELVDPDADHIAKHPKILRALAAQDENEAVGARYRFLLQLLLDNGALHHDESGIWALRGTCSVDESVPRGTGASPEQAIDSAIKASKALEGG